MKAGEGRLGRVFVISLEPGDVFPAAVEEFATAHGIFQASVFWAGEGGGSTLLAPDANGRPVFITKPSGATGISEVVIQELLGVNVRQASRGTSGTRIDLVKGSITRVMKKPAPAPEETESGTVPVYLFNAEFN
ncbi:MAG: hypothetical protein LBU79_07370 [Planctomycetota bacterium]|jgi:hypothetical protein|nr:hypothetical protein [Planctomycetota bacterium]